MKINSIIIFLIFLILRGSLCAQSIIIKEAQSVITEDKDIIQYLIQKDVCYDESHGLGTAFAVDLLTLKGLTANDKYGLYKIGTFNSHSFSHLMWLENGKKYFIDCQYNLSETIKKVFVLWEKSKYKIPDSDKILYIEQIIGTYDANRPSPDELEPNVIN